MRQKCSRDPKNLECAVPKVNEYPQKNHWKEIRQIAIIDAHNRDRACFFLDIPE